MKAERARAKETREDTRRKREREREREREARYDNTTRVCAERRRRSLGQWRSGCKEHRTKNSGRKREEKRSR